MRVFGHVQSSGQRYGTVESQGQEVVVGFEEAGLGEPALAFGFVADSVFCAFAVKFALKEQALAYAGVILIPEFVMAGSGSIGGLGVEHNGVCAFAVLCIPYQRQAIFVGGAVELSGVVTGLPFAGVQEAVAGVEEALGRCMGLHGVRQTGLLRRHHVKVVAGGHAEEHRS